VFGGELVDVSGEHRTRQPVPGIVRDPERVRREQQQPGRAARLAAEQLTGPSARARFSFSWIALSWQALMTGPMSLSSAAGSPARRHPTVATNRSVNSWCTVRSTISRLTITQIWPWWKNEPNTAASTARARSASSRTTKGPLPPSSSASRPAR
jgi:hypothetical protein